MRSCSVRGWGRVSVKTNFETRAKTHEGLTILVEKNSEIGSERYESQAWCSQVVRFYGP